MEDFQISGDTLVRYSGKDTAVLIPEFIKHISWGAFSYNGMIEHVILPQGLISIGESAFANCKRLSFIGIYDPSLRERGSYSKFPDSLTSIGKCAFEWCESLYGTIILPDNIKVICNKTFECCFSLSGVFLPKSLEIIESEAFSCCSKLYALECPSSLKTIEEYAFHDCEELFRVSIPTTITRVAENAFWGCKNVEGYSGPKKYEHFFLHVVRENEAKQDNPTMVCFILSILALLISATYSFIAVILATAILVYIYKKIRKCYLRERYLKAAKVLSIIAGLISASRVILLLFFG